MNLRKGIFKKAIAHTLLMSLLCSVLPTNAYADGLGGENFGGGNSHSVGKGSYDDIYTGYRISIVNESGQVVSRVVDLLFSSPANLRVNYIAATNTKVQPYSTANLAAEPTQTQV